MRINRTFTVNAGVPVNVATGAATSDGIVRYASRVFLQVIAGANEGLVYVMDGIYGVNADGTPRIPSSANAGDITAYLAPGTTAVPGGTYSDNDFRPSGGIDITRMWVDGAHTGDTVKFSCDLND